MCVYVAHDMYYNELARLLQCVHYVTDRPAKANKPDARYSLAALAARRPDASLINSQHRRTRGDLNMQMI